MTALTLPAATVNDRYDDRDTRFNDTLRRIHDGALCDHVKTNLINQLFDALDAANLAEQNRRIASVNTELDMLEARQS